jgi:hypothetical protein
VNCVIALASAGRFYPVSPTGNYQTSFKELGAAEVSAANASRGDVIQVGERDSSFPLHTAIVLDNLGAGRFRVVDSNYGTREIVTTHDYTPPAGFRIWRVGDAGETRTPPPPTPTPNPTPNPSPPPSCTESPDTVVVYEHPPATGLCRTLGVGEYRNPGAFAPVPNDTISAVFVGSNVNVMLCRDDQFNGGCTTKDSTDRDLHDEDWGDKTSSIKVTNKPSPGPGAPPPTATPSDTPPVPSNPELPAAPPGSTPSDGNSVPSSPAPPSTTTPPPAPPQSSCELDAPTFVYPQHDQVVGFDGGWMFKVNDLPCAEGYLWGFFQDGEARWENYANEGMLSGPEYAISEDSAARPNFHPGDVDVWVSALIAGQWTDAAIITIHLA